MIHTGLDELGQVLGFLVQFLWLWAIKIHGKKSKLTLLQHPSYPWSCIAPLYTYFFPSFGNWKELGVVRREYKESEHNLQCRWSQRQVYIRKTHSYFLRLLLNILVVPRIYFHLSQFPKLRALSCPEGTETQTWGFICREISEFRLEEFRCSEILVTHKCGVLPSLWKTTSSGWPCACGIVTGLGRALWLTGKS